MSKRTVTDCDGCSAKAVVAPHTISLVVGWQRDPSGYGGDGTITEDVDLCPGCLAGALLALLGDKAVTDEQRRAWVERIKRRGKAGV